MQGLKVLKELKSLVLLHKFWAATVITTSLGTSIMAYYVVDTLAKAKQQAYCDKIKEDCNKKGVHCYGIPKGPYDEKEKN